MSTALRVGLNYVLVKQESSYDPIQGAQTVSVYEGDLDGIALAIDSLEGYQRFEVDQTDPPIVRLTVYSPAPTEQPVFELLSNHIEKDIYELPTFKVITLHDLKVLAKFMKNPIEGADPAFTGTGPQLAAALNLYILLTTGTKKFFDDQVVLRYQVTVSTAAQVTMAYGNSKKVFTPDQLLNPAISNLIIPEGILLSIAQIEAPTFAPIDDTHTLLWGWYKHRPTSRVTRRGQVVVTGEYWLAPWDLVVYEHVP